MPQFSEDGDVLTLTGPARFDRVESRLEAIFGRAQAPPPVPFSPRALPVVIAAPRRRRGAVAGVALAAVAAIAGVGVGIAMSDRGERVVYRSMIPVPAPTPAPVVAPATAKVARAPEPERPRAKPVARLVASADAPPRVRKIAKPATPVAVAKKRAGACDGSRGVASFACQVEELDTADRDLVEAYAAAIDAGVPRAHLVSVNKRWVRARDRARYDPADAVQSYRRLAGELRIAQREELSGDE